MMNREKLRQKIQSILIDTLEISENDLDFDIPLQELGLDSLGTVELITKVESVFEIGLPSDISKILKTGNDIVYYLEKLQEDAD